MRMPQLSDDWTLEFAPEMGGSVTRCQFQGVDILRPAVSLDDPRMCSAFPMVPFIGRITNGKFVFEGHAYTLSPNMPPEPHAIHGRGWQSPWEIQQKGHDVILTQTHVPSENTGDTGNWPWAYHARQSFSAQGKVLRLEMTLTNRANTLMPAGLGWHPYFPKAGASLKADVSAIWQSGGGGIIGDRPRQLSPANDLRRERPIEMLDLDNCYTARNASAVIEWPERNLGIRLLSVAEFEYLTVYTPPGEDYFCVEPVSHIPDAINSKLKREDTGFQILRPGETLEGHLAISVTLDS